MGSLFSKIDLKICKACGKEKPIVEFSSKGIKNGVRIYAPYCKPCHGPIRWASTSPDARDKKRERDRALLKTSKGKARSARSTRQRRKKEKVLLAERNVGAFCLVQWHTCDKCNKTRYHKNKYISDTLCGACRRVERLKGRTFDRPAKTVYCSDCGTAHVAYMDGARCDTCKASAKKAWRQTANRTYGKSVTSRARKRGVHVETVNRMLVYKRDKYKCYMCGTKVVACDGYQDNMATLDHVIPLAKGGSHTYDNIKTCCARCNSHKSAEIREGTQISMFCAVTQGGGSDVGAY